MGVWSFSGFQLGILWVSNGRLTVLNVAKVIFWLHYGFCNNHLDILWSFSGFVVGDFDILYDFGCRVSILT